MKSFRHNLTEENLLLNATIACFFKEEEPIFIKIPKIRESIEDPNFSKFLSIMILKLTDYDKINLIVKPKSSAEGMIALIRESSEVRKEIKPYVEKYILNSEVSHSGIKVDGRTLEIEEIDFFRNVILISFGIKDLKDLEEEKKTKGPDLSKMSKTERAIYQRQEETLRRLKEAKQKSSQKEEGYNFSKIVVGVMKEFAMSLEEIKDLNYYTLYYLFSYVFKIDHYDFMKKAAASGNLAKKTKIKHWLE